MSTIHDGFVFVEMAGLPSTEDCENLCPKKDLSLIKKVCEFFEGAKKSTEEKKVSFDFTEIILAESEDHAEPKLADPCGTKTCEKAGLKVQKNSCLRMGRSKHYETKEEALEFEHIRVIGRHGIPYALADKAATIAAKRIHEEVLASSNQEVSINQYVFDFIDGK